jgi:hypothetical protein
LSLTQKLGKRERYAGLTILIAFPYDLGWTVPQCQNGEGLLQQEYVNFKQWFTEKLYYAGLRPPAHCA